MPAHLPKLMPTPQTLAGSRQGGWLPVTTESSAHIRLSRTAQLASDRVGGAETDTEIESEEWGMVVCAFKCLYLGGRSRQISEYEASVLHTESQPGLLHGETIY